MLPEMLRVAVSIGAGRIKPSTILRRLATYSRKSKLYLARREPGHAFCAGFLLNFLFDIESRRLIQGATNKSERCNQFLKWVAFRWRRAGRLRVSGTNSASSSITPSRCQPTDLSQRRDLGKALERLVAEGYEVDAELIACFSPYLTGHLNRFGRYTLNRDRVPEPLDNVREFKIPPRGEGKAARPRSQV